MGTMIAEGRWVSEEMQDWLKGEGGQNLLNHIGGLPADIQSSLRAKYVDIEHHFSRGCWSIALWICDDIEKLTGDDYQNCLKWVKIIMGEKY